MFQNLGSLKPYFWRYRWGFVLGTITVVIQNCIWVMFPLILGLALDDLNGKVASDRRLIHALQRLGLDVGSGGLTSHKLLIYALLVLGVASAKSIFLFLTRWKVIGISREIEFDLRNDLFRHLEDLSYSYYQRSRTGDIMARATNDLNAVRMLLGPAIMYTANTVVFTVLALILMWQISPRLTLYTFLPLPLASILIQYFGHKIHERF